MSEIAPFISDLAVILVAAGIFTLLFKRLRQPVILGYIVAGLVAGPAVPWVPSVTDPANIKIWADIGVIFLLFAMGLEFSFRKLLGVGGTAVIAAAVIVTGMMSAGYLAGHLLGFGHLSALFLGGMLPGLLMGMFQLAVSYVISVRRQYPKGAWQGWRFFLKTAKSSFFAFMLPVIVVYCLIGGVGTVVEIGAIAVVCAVIISAFIYRGMNLRQFLTCFARAAMMAAKVLPCLAVAGVFTWIISSIGVSSALKTVLMGATGSPVAALALMMAVLLLFGMILDVNVIQMVIVPAMVPVVKAFGIDPIQFGVVGMLVCQMGLITPPVGTLIYITASIAEVNPLKVAKELMPFILALIVLVGLMIVFPAITTWFPNLIYSMG